MIATLAQVIVRSLGGRRKPICMDSPLCLDACPAASTQANCVTALLIPKNVSAHTPECPSAAKSAVISRGDHPERALRRHRCLAARGHPENRPLGTPPRGERAFTRAWRELAAIRRTEAAGWRIDRRRSGELARGARRTPRHVARLSGTPCPAWSGSRRGPSTGALEPDALGQLGPGHTELVRGPCAQFLAGTENDRWPRRIADVVRGVG